MKELYIFSVKDSFAKLYRDKPSELFFIYNRIYNMKHTDKEYGFNLFSQVSNFLDRDYINNYLSKKYKDQLMYSYYNNEHVINNLFLNEISILTVNNSNLKLETNINNSNFLDDLKKLKGNFFICDFKESDYYFVIKNTILN